MSVKNGVGTSLLLFGILIFLIGSRMGAKPEVTQTYNGVEQVVFNRDSYNLNWRMFWGGVVIFLGAGLLIFPSQAKIDEGKFD
jgi:hypothetical protein